MLSSRTLRTTSLPNEVLHLAFDALDPSERALISSTCQQWHRLIIHTQAWWRDLIVEEGKSIDTAILALQIFTDRSKCTLIRVAIKPKIEKESDLQAIFSLLRFSNLSITRLGLAQLPTFNTKTRLFAQKLTNLEILFAIEELKFNRVALPLKARGEGLIRLQIDNLMDVKETEFQWFSSLKELSVIKSDSIEKFKSILKECKYSLESLHFEEILRDPPTIVHPLFRNRGPVRSTTPSIKMTSLRHLGLPQGDISVGTILSAPNLETIAPATLDQLIQIQVPTVKKLHLVLEDELALSWDAGWGDRFTNLFGRVMQEKTNLKHLVIFSPSGKHSVQLGRIFQALSDTDLDLCPKLVSLQVRPPVPDMEKVVELVEMRKKSSGANNFDFFFSSDRDEVLIRWARKYRETKMAMSRQTVGNKERRNRE